MRSHWREGYDAFVEGQALNTNPYAVGTQAHVEWREGWLDGAHGYEVDEEET